MVLRRSYLARIGALAAPAIVPAAVALPTLPASAASQSLALAGTSSPVTGASDTGSSGPEFPAQEEEGTPDAGPVTITDRSLSQGHGPGKGVSVNSGKKAKSNPSFVSGFEGLNLYQQRYARRGNQFTLEPPDQGLCVGGGYVVESVNDVMNVYDTSGTSRLPDNTATNIVADFPRDVHHAVDLNSFYGYPPAVNRTTGAQGQFVTDPSCLYDVATQRFFMVVLTIERTLGAR